MKKKKVLTLFSLAILIFLLIGCSGKSAGVLETKSAGVLETGKTYFGRGATNEIIEVQDSDTWTIKNMNKDDTNYTIAKVSETGEEFGGYPVFRITAEEMYGDLDSVFAKRKGEDYIIVEDEEGAYFESLTESSMEELTKGLSETKNSDAYIKETALYHFEKQ